MIVLIDKLPSGQAATLIHGLVTICMNPLLQFFLTLIRLAFVQTKRLVTSNIGISLLMSLWTFCAYASISFPGLPYMFFLCFLITTPILLLHYQSSEKKRKIKKNALAYRFALEEIEQGPMLKVSMEDP